MAAAALISGAASPAGLAYGKAERKSDSLPPSSLTTRLFVLEAAAKLYAALRSLAPFSY